MVFTPLTVVAGINASGKSNLFDALKLLSRLAETDLKTAFNEQRGDPNELFTQYSEGVYADEMEFVVDILVDRHISDNWGGFAELNNTYLRYTLRISRDENQTGFQALSIRHESLEKIKADDSKWPKEFIPAKHQALWKSLKAGGSKEAFIRTEREGNVMAIKIRQDGRQGGKATPANAASQTVLGGINSVDFPHAFAAKEEMRSWRFLQLNPEDLREPTRQHVSISDEITSSGKNLAAALFRIKQSDKYALTAISRKLNSFLPNFIQVDVYDDKANQQYIIKLRGSDQREFTTRVLSEGTLRLLALCILEYDEKHKGLLCFEEPENGIHPFRLTAMADLLKDLSANFYADEATLRQVIVNTHSPILVKELHRHRAANNSVSVYLSKSHTLITDFKGKKHRLQITKTVPVVQENIQNSQLQLFSTDGERKITLIDVAKYLDSPVGDSQTVIAP